VINHPIAKATAAAAFMTEDRVLQLFLPSLVTMLPDVATIEPCWWRRLSQSKSSIARCNKSPRLCGDRSKTGQLDGPLPLLLAEGSSDSH